MIGAPPPKKAIMISILNILKNHSDKEHPLSQEDIRALLESEYLLKVDRKAVKRNLYNLIDLEESIGYSVTKRTIRNKTGEEEVSVLYSDFYFESDFDDSEIRLLLDSVIFSPHIPAGQRKQLIEKIEKLASNYFRNNTRSIEVVNSVTSQNREWFHTLDIVNDAITRNRKIRFTYNEYGIDAKLHPAGNVTVCPFRIIAHNNHYYLLANDPDTDDYVHYRIDRITGPSMLENEKLPPQTSFNINEYVHSHPYMFSGKRERIRMIADSSVLEGLFDWFGDDVQIQKTDDDQLDITLYSALTDFYYWALRYGDYVEVVSPKELRYRIRETVEIMAKTYLRSSDDMIQKAIDAAEKTGVLDLRQIDLRDININCIPNDITGLMLGLNRIHDYSFIKRFKGLKYLRIGSRVDDFAFLNDLTQLTTLKLKGTGISDLSLIRQLPLKKLYLDEVKPIDHLEIVYEISSLDELILSRKQLNSIDKRKLLSINPAIRVGMINPPMLYLRGFIDSEQ